MSNITPASMLEKLSLVDNPNRRLGENGHIELTFEGLGDAFLGLFDKLVRGLDTEILEGLIDNVLKETSTPESVKNLFLLAFQTRWCRGGKGERNLFYKFIIILYDKGYRDEVLAIIHLIPLYGYWKDLLSLLLECNNKDVDYAPLRSKIWILFAKQIKEDYNEVTTAEKEGRRPCNISLVGKFAPSEGKKFSKLLKADKEICLMLFEAIKGKNINDEKIKWNIHRGKYRRILTKLRKALNVTEVLMCANIWSEIKLLNVSSIAMARYKRAFLNEGKNKNKEDDPDRIMCKEKFVKILEGKKAGKLNGKQLFPHELVAEVLKKDLSDLVKLVLNTQWKAVRTGLLEQVEARKAELAASAMSLDDADAACMAAADKNHNPVLEIVRDVLVNIAVTTGASKPTDMSRLVCMADVSGSMSGIPMHVAIALGILVSEVCHPAFRKKVLTFSTDPKWHTLPDGPFVDKVESLSSAHWGMSTNFEKAMWLIIEMVISNRLEQHDIPDLLVVSDMQFNEANNGNTWNTAYENIEKMFRDTGIKVHKKPLTPPKIIFWNVRADTCGYPAAADQKGVMLLSGYSPSLMKFILSGEMEEEVAETIDSDGNIVKVTRQINPSEALQRILNDSGLDAVRAVLDALPKKS